MDYKKMMATILRTPSSEASKKSKKKQSETMKTKMTAFKKGFKKG